MRAAVRGLVADALTRMVRRLGHAARRAAGQPARFVAWLDRLESEHVQTIGESLAPSLAAWSVARGQRFDPTLTASDLVEEVREALLELAGQSTAAELGAKVEAYLAAVEGDVSRLRVSEILAG
jgi:class 3 adenylate cyclase